MGPKADEPHAFLPFGLLIAMRLPHAWILTISRKPASPGKCRERRARNAVVHRGANSVGRCLSRLGLNEADLHCEAPALLSILFLAGLVLQLTGALLLLTPRDLNAFAFVGAGLFISLSALTLIAIT
jgi:hypothetical protein